MNINATCSRSQTKPNQTKQHTYVLHNLVPVTLFRELLHMSSRLKDKLLKHHFKTPHFETQQCKYVFLCVTHCGVDLMHCTEDKLNTMGSLYSEYMVQRLVRYNCHKEEACHGKSRDELVVPKNKNKTTLYITNVKSNSRNASYTQKDSEHLYRQNYLNWCRDVVLRRHFSVSNIGYICRCGGPVKVMTTTVLNIPSVIVLTTDHCITSL